MFARLKFIFCLLIAFSAIFLFWTKEAFAAFNITAISPSKIISSDEIITVVATVSGLRSNPQYLQIGLTLSGTTTNLFGITKNNGDEWYFYKSSPTASDLTSTFYSFIHEDGSWFGEVFGKIDITDNGYCGPGEYKLRLYKYTISSSQSVSSSFVEWGSTITVNIPLPPASTSTPEPEEEDEEESTSATPTPTPTPISIPTPTKKPTPTKTPTPTATPSGEILGEEATPEAEVISFNLSQESTPSSFNLQSFLPLIFIGLGSLLLAIAGGSVLLPQIKKKYNIKKRGESKTII